ncbi:acyl-CoA dehydrogenase [Nocardiopsis gilva YIM 90087]|uniref:Acyl-CoA dehydrogenase n=1 Tax=Nocardiopsis gilva YIM 90087 TaxID=1235441 RepID=A0A223SBN3_9ACTN|nr:acyl-CoA dehydrogenase family protein [Nocardiopsis gilva]ASU85429.1 acyl-CoA dehydrogenase [Nocardiopsis gilva YIM 90087]
MRASETVGRGVREQEPPTFGDEERRTGRIAARLVEEIASGGLDLPLPGSGSTWVRWERLRDLAREDLSLARLAEGHTDAIAILSELGGWTPEPASVWGVWAAHPPGTPLIADKTGGRWRLHGAKPFCSGARVCTHALVSADVAGGERRLFAIRTDGTKPRPGTWASAGMAASDTLTVHFDGVGAEPVGRPGDYVGRPGFHHGGAGVAACWFGGALAVARPLAARAGRDEADAHLLSAFGAVDRELYAAGSVLRRASREIDDHPLDRSSAAVRAARVRAVVADTCTRVLRRTGEALGAGPLAGDVVYARATADLCVYIRQHHAERDLAELGTLVASGTWMSGADDY